MRLNRTSILALGFALSVASSGLVSAHALPPSKAVAAPSVQDSVGIESSVVPTSACVSSITEELFPGTALHASTLPATGTILAARKNCEAALAACMNGGGGTDACWNAYWRCISN